jgi:hypothetical protein
MITTSGTLAQVNRHFKERKATGEQQGGNARLLISGFGVRVPDGALFPQVRGHLTVVPIKIIPIYPHFSRKSGADEWSVDAARTPR